MPLGDNYLGAIKKFEGFYQKPYWDYKQWTSGYGTKAANPGEVIDQAEADRRLRNELGSARNMVLGLGVPLNPGQEAALTSLTFNAGPRWINSGLGAAVRAGNWDEARNRFLQYTKAGGKDLPGLVARRQAEAAWLTGGAPTASATPAVASAAPASSGASSMAMPPSNGWTPESVESSRRIAKALMGQGMDSSPVGHWTQALARVLQTGVGTAWDSQANVAEREGKKQVADYMSANAGASPQQFAAGLVANPFSADMGQRMMLQNMQRAPELEIQRERLKIDQQNAARQSALTAAQLQQIKMQTPEWRMANAARFGIDPNSREGRAFIITGNYASPSDPLRTVKDGETLVRVPTAPGAQPEIVFGAPNIDATTKKAIDEADDFIAQTNSAIGSLNKALELNNVAYDGAGAKAAAGVVNNTLGRFVSRPGALATTELENIVVNQALSSLRATFGGNPTEGERKILLDVAGSVSQPAAVRERIFKRALEAAQTRLRFNQEKAERLRSGTYYKPGGQPPAARDAGPQTSPGARMPNRYINHQTGEIVEWNGREYVRIGGVAPSFPTVDANGIPYPPASR